MEIENIEMEIRVLLTYLLHFSEKFQVIVFSEVKRFSQLSSSAFLKQSTSYD